MNDSLVPRSNGAESAAAAFAVSLSIPSFPGGM